MKVRPRRTEEQQSIQAGKKHPLMRITDEQIEDYINTNVTDLASAKAAMIEITKLLKLTMVVVAKEVRR